MSGTGLRRRRWQAIPAAFLLLVWVALLCGCRKPVHFPAISDSETASHAGALSAYDADHDGRVDFFMIANQSGRVDRIGYDVTGNQMPDQIIPLDAIDFARCRHLFIVLDGFGYDLVNSYYADGSLRAFHPPSRVIAPYPTMTDLCVQDLIGGVPPRAIEAMHFDRRENRLVGGSNDYLAGKNEPYNRVMQYRAGTLWDVLGYMDPWAVFGKEVNDAKRVFDRAETREVMGYFVSSAGVGTRMGAEGQTKCLKRIEQFVNQVLWETRGLTKVTLTSDHGHSYTPAERIDLEAYLRGKGWRLANRLGDPDDVVYVQFGLVTFARFATRKPAELAADLVGCEGVELASYADAQAVVILSADGGRAKISRSNGRYSYQPDEGDPLKLDGILAGLEDSNGFYRADDLLKATIEHDYPAPLQRLWRAHFGLVSNTPDVIVSLADRYYAGAKSLAGSVSIASTHGGLNRTNSTTFIMSTVGPLPGPMRSHDIPEAMEALTGEPWPLGK